MAARNSAQTAHAAQNAAQAPENSAAIHGAVDAIMVMRGFVPGTQVPQNNPNHVAEFRQVLVQRGRENDPDATLIMLAVVAPQQNQAVAFKGVSSRDSM